ncbi:MAG: S-adenosylmethionine decarboxylase [Thermomicrobiales bacterium]
MQMQHLVVDAFVADGQRLGDVAAIFDLLDTLPARIGMTKIAPPYVFRYSGVKPEDWGVTGVVIIAESHISIHTFAEHKRFHLDVFSCKPFDVDMVRDRICALFGVTDMAAAVVHRVAEPARDDWHVERLGEPALAGAFGD